MKNKLKKVLIGIILLVIVVVVGCIIGLKLVKDNMNETSEAHSKETNNEESVLEEEYDPLVEGVDEGITEDTEDVVVPEVNEAAPIEEVAANRVKTFLVDGFPCEDYEGIVCTPTVNEDGSITVVASFNGYEPPITAFCSPDGEPHRFSHLGGEDFITEEQAFFEGNDWVKKTEGGEYYYEK